MTEAPIPEIEMHAPRERRYLRVAIGCTIAALMVTGGAFAMRGASEPTSVASRGTGDDSTTTSLIELFDRESVAPTGESTTTTAATKVPRVTVPTIPKVLPTTKPTTPRGPVVCPAYPAARTLPAKGTYSVPTNGGAPKKLLEWDEEHVPQSIDLSPDGTQLLITRNANEPDQAHINTISIANADGSGEHQIFKDRRYPANAHWSPDGHSFAFRDSLPGDPYTIGTFVADRLTLSTKLVGTNGQSLGMYSWSPDSRHLAWGEYGVPGVFVGHVDGSVMQRIAADRPPVVDTAWSPDSKQIVATAQNAPTMLYSIDGSFAKDLQRSGLWVEWSPNNRAHLVIDGVLVDPDSGESFFLGGGGLHGIFADGSHIVTADITGVHFVDLDGCKQTIIAGRGDEIGERDWSDDGKQLIAMRFV